MERFHYMGVSILAVNGSQYVPKLFEKKRNLAVGKTKSLCAISTLTIVENLNYALSSFTYFSYIVVFEES
jgi:hypothetical protein